MEDILQPIKEYDGKFKYKIADTTKNYYKELVEKSGVDAAANKATVAEYDAVTSDLGDAHKEVKTGKIIRVVCIVLAVFTIILGIIFSYVSYKVANGNTTTLSLTASIILTVVFFLIAIGLIVFICLYLNKELERDTTRAKKLSSQANEVKKVAISQMNPLNRLFNDTISREIINSVTPNIQIDQNFSVEREQMFARHYGLSDIDNDYISTTRLLSGVIDGYPFLLERQKVQQMINKAYTGVRIVTWTERRRDSEGKMTTVRKSQTLTATILKPFPDYNDLTFLVYGNDLLSSLNFSRTPVVNGKSESQIDKIVDRGEKKLVKRQDKAIKSGEGTFTALANTEFEVLFGAYDRDDEVKFRMMYTPLAQSNTVELIKNKDGYGDNFKFIKKSSIHYILAEHVQNYDFDLDPARFHSHSLELSEATFNEFHNSLFKNLYYNIAPVLSIPLYQQHDPRAHDIDSDFSRCVTAREAEVLINKLPGNILSPVGLATSNIIRTTIISSKDGVDTLKVTACGHRCISRVDFVPVLCRNRKMYQVPVHWNEYLPISKDTIVKVGKIEAMKALGIEGNNKAIITERGMFACINK